MIKNGTIIKTGRQKYWCNSCGNTSINRKKNVSLPEETINTLKKLHGEDSVDATVLMAVNSFIGDR